MIDLVQVRSFVSVIERGGFAAAALMLGIAQPTVSQHVAKLEAALGASLVNRGRGGCEPTRHGARFLPFARMLLRTAERAAATVSGDVAMIGASTNIGTYLLQPYLRAFRDAVTAAHPFDVVIGSNPETVRRLEEGEIDVALMEWWDFRPGFQAKLWRQEQLVVIVPPDHPWVARRSVSKRTLLDTPMLGGEPGTGTARVLQQVFGAAADSLKIDITLNGTEAVKRAVMAGLGISIILEAAVREEIDTGRLCAIPIAGVSLSKDVYIVVPEGLPEGSLAGRFSEFLAA